MEKRSNGYEDLEVWKLAKTLAVEVYKITKAFPKEDLYGITSQIRRCSLSIPSNLAEGSARGSKKEFARFVMIALGSTAELNTQLLVAKEIGILSETDYNAICTKLGRIGKMLKGLERSMRTNNQQQMTNDQA